jgi:hypothetical protein
MGLTTRAGALGTGRSDRTPLTGMAVGLALWIGGPLRATLTCWISAGLIRLFRLRSSWPQAVPRGAALRCLSRELLSGKLCEAQGT